MHKTDQGLNGERHSMSTAIGEVAVELLLSSFSAVGGCDYHRRQRNQRCVQAAELKGDQMGERSTSTTRIRRNGRYRLLIAARRLES